MDCNPTHTFHTTLNITRTYVSHRAHIAVHTIMEYMLLIFATSVTPHLIHGRLNVYWSDPRMCDVFACIVCGVAVFRQIKFVII
jgi:hypothetical protein